MKRLAIIGGAQETDDYNPPVKNREKAIETANFIGKALAEKGYGMVISSHEDIEKAAVSGFLAARPYAKEAIIFIFPQGDEGPSALGDLYKKSQGHLCPNLMQENVGGMTTSMRFRPWTALC